MLLPVCAFAQLQNTGWKSPSATHAPNGWTNPQNAYVSDDVYTTVAHQSGCRCPFMDLSWDDGTSYTPYKLFGIFGTVDFFITEGDSTDNWGHAWTVTELSDPIFVLRIWNPSTLIRQGYAGFQFGIPPGSTVSGIEVRVEEHGDTAYITEFVDVIQARVYYYAPTVVNEVYADSYPVSVYPNPAQDKVHIRVNDNEGKMQVNIFNASGQLMNEMSFPASAANGDYVADINHLEAGMYFINIITAGKSINTKLIVE